MRAVIVKERKDQLDSGAGYGKVCALQKVRIFFWSCDRLETIKMVSKYHLYSFQPDS